MDDEYRSLLIDAYKGELFGEALFGAFAACEADGEPAEKLRALERIEGDTATRLKRLVDAAAIDISDTDVAATREQGRAIGSQRQRMGRVREGSARCPAPIPRQFRAVAFDSRPTLGDPALVALVAHEQAINAFAELELAGESSCSLAVLQWHLESVA